MARLIRFGSTFCAAACVIFLALGVAFHPSLALADDCNPGDPNCVCDYATEPPTCHTFVNECDENDPDCECDEFGCHLVAKACSGCGGTCSSDIPPCAGTCPGVAACSSTCGCGDTGNNSCACK
jgi:hypothetical protein